MTKKKVTLSIEPVLLHIAREKKMNLSAMLEYMIASEIKIRKITLWERVIESY